ncbi:hypothetical protein [Virgibacillus oceani]|uniref:Prenyltransferase n=1 Tax=Virgibacillus oceani TaxID=1479511 RepID=A0A917HMR0_9BACI|nr:hypothetical protein [Virgibacillus oceani]GGG83806.1 hypothetical protein GCM10011398_31700 [Virgibacillus oceani]
MKLSREQFNLAKNFIKTQARYIDKALFDFHFESGDPEEVAKELKKFQNNDGGFGNAIEPDFRLPNSSPMATTIGMQYAKEINLHTDHAIVNQAINYLLTNYDEDERRWHAVPKEVNEFAHAPWWHFDIEKNRCGVEDTWANPSAEIASYFNLYNSLVSKDFLDMINLLALDELTELPEQIEMHDFACYQRLLDTAPPSIAETILQCLEKSVAITNFDKSKWSDYGITPLHVCLSPDSPFYKFVKEEMEENLDYVINNFTSEGSWNPNWSWFGQYDEEWNHAKNEWKGYITLRNLLTLRSFDRIEGVSN